MHGAKLVFSESLQLKLVSFAGFNYCLKGNNKCPDSKVKRTAKV